MFACHVALAASSASAQAADPSAPASAESGARPPVRVDGNECRLAPLDDVIAVLRIELPSRLVEGSATGPAYEIALDCAADVIGIRVGAPWRPDRRYRTSLRGAPPSVRSRIVALAIAELVRDLDRELASAPAAAPARGASPSRGKTPADDLREEREPGARPRYPVELGALAQASTFGLDGRWLLGGGLRFEYAGGSICAGVDAVLLASDERFDFGAAQSVLSYAGPYAGWSDTVGPLHLRLGAGHAVGAARLAGRTTQRGVDADSVSGPWSAPYGFAALAVAITRALRLDARLQAGWVASPVVGEVSRGGDVQLRGLWTSVQMGWALGL
jgi:hypothetical protein